MKRILIIAGIIGYTIPLAWADSPALTLSDLLRQARERNPDIQAAQQAWKVKRAETSAAKVWPDPTLSYEQETMTTPGPGMAQEKKQNFRVEQPIPFPGKITQDAQMKHHEALLAYTVYRARALEVFRDVRMRYYQLYLTDEKISLAAQSIEVMRTALRSSQGRLAANQGGTSDVFMAQTELRRMENMLFEQKQQRILIAIELNTLLNQPIETPLGSAQPPEIRDIPATTAELRTLAERNAPLYQSAMHEMNHSQAMRRRTRLTYAPDLAVMYEYQKAQAGGENGRILGVSVTFPLWLQRPWAMNRAAAEHLLEAQASAQAMKNMVLKMLHMEVTETQTHLRLARNYQNDILPTVLANLKVSRQAYAAGQSDFLRLLEAVRSWIAVHNEYQEQVYHYGNHWSELERWIGVELVHAKEALEQTKWTQLEDNRDH